MKTLNKIKTPFIIGPTATGKTSLAVKLAKKFNGEIISVDSRQVYKGMDLGTGKDIEEYGLGEDKVNYHLIDVVEPNHEYNLFEFVNDVYNAFNKIISNNKTPFFSGGSALYLNAILKGYKLKGNPPNKEIREKYNDLNAKEIITDLNINYPNIIPHIKEPENKNRILRVIENINTSCKVSNSITDMIEPLVLGVYFPRETVWKRIRERLIARINSGLIEEVERLHNEGVSWERLDFFGLEYRYVAQYLQGVLTKEEMTEKLYIKIRQFAKRQDIWYRKFEKEGIDIYWIKEGDFSEAENILTAFLENQNLPTIDFRLYKTLYGPKSS
jgi:tRNA dimethylallyltransferase